MVAMAIAGKLGQVSEGTIGDMRRPLDAYVKIFQMGTLIIMRSGHIDGYPIEAFLGIGPTRCCDALMRG